MQDWDHSPKRQLLLGSVDDLEAQGGVAGGALERIYGAGGRSVSADPTCAKRACGFNR